MPSFLSAEDLFQMNTNQFDFGIRFEQLFFSIIPSVLFIIASSWRTFSQARKVPVVGGPAFQLVKAATITIFVAVELALLVLAVGGSLRVSRMFVVASILKLVAALLMIALSILDHSRSLRPSLLLNIYLPMTLLLDASQARTLFLLSDSKPELTYSGVFTAAVALKLTLLLLEAKQKSSWALWDKKEDHSPEETSGIFSIGAYSWLNKLFRMGYGKILTIEDLYPLDNSMNSKALLDDFSRDMDYSKLKGDRFGLLKLLIRTLRVSLLLPVLPRLALLGFTLCQPLFLGRLLDYLSQPQLSTSVGYGLIGATFLIYSGIAISTALYWYLHNRTRVMIRSLLVTEIFTKATKFRIGVGNETAALTLMSTDIERIRVGFRNLHEIWASLIQASLAAWMLYDRLGIVFVASVGIVMVCFIALGVLMKFIGGSQRTWMTHVQRRVGLTATVIASMKNLKMSGLDSAVADFVKKLRDEELAAGVRWRKIFITAALLGFVPQLIAPPLTFAFTRRSLDASTVFTSLSFITLLTYPLSQVFEGIPQIMSGLACLGRIQAFLECESRVDFRQISTETKRKMRGGSADTQGSCDALLTIKDGRFGWSPGKYVLQNVDTKVTKFSLTIIIGSIGSGKSTLCKALLGEIPFSEGTVSSARLAHVGYCEQTAFLSNGTIRDNIVGFTPFDSQRYTEVVDATVLHVDIANLPQGDQTNIGSDGVTLSGGQKQRLSLARALYLQSDLLILDDIFSGLDVDSEERVFQNVFGPAGLLKRRNSTVVLCTHSVKHLPAADHVLVLANGTVAEQGSFSELMTRGGYVQDLKLRPHSNMDGPSEQPMSQHSVHEPALEQLHTLRNRTPPTVLKADQSRQTGDTTVYKYYAKSAGLLVTAFALFFAALWGFFTNFPTIWLSYWTEDVYSRSYTFYAGLYAFLQTCALLSLLLLSVTLWVFALEKAGATLHQEALQTLIRAPLRFFTKTDTGIVTNLFSQDLNLIDTELPNATLDTLFSVFQSLGQAAVMLTSSVYLAIAYPFLAALLYGVGRFYLRTSRQLRILDLEAKSPLYTLFQDTIKGITTLRAFGFLPNNLQNGARLLDTSQRPAYLLLMIQEWLKLVLNLVVMALAVILVTLSVRLHSSSTFAGASLYSLITFGENLAGIVLYYTRLETSIGAVARLKKFGETVKPENKDEEDIIPPEEWPQSGVVELKGVCASYDVEDENTANLALRKIDLKIRAGEKVAICGRTGSGKSSLIAFLLKLLDPLPAPAGGDAAIDGTPLCRIDRSVLRQRIIAVPQEAVFLPDGATFMANLDLGGVSSPTDCEAVLAAVGLWDLVCERGGLCTGMSSGTLSVGQRQLLSVGRALLRRRMLLQTRDGRRVMEEAAGILLLDEVSSSVDHETERVIQEVIRAEFQGYTVIAVSHRLDMIMDFDRVIMMDRGEVVEVGAPAVLVGRAGSRLGDLVRLEERDK